MAATLRALCKYSKENYAMNLICGEQNLNNLVGWVHMLEDPATAAFLHGQELIFTTGIGHENTDWLLDFAKGLVRYGASGWVINLGPYIESLPKGLVAYCREVKFPLFTIPWSTRIVDITNDFCRKIIKAEETEVSIVSAFKNAIFFPESLEESRAILNRKEFDTEGIYTVAALQLQVPTQEQYSGFDKSVRLHLTKALIGHHENFAIFRHDRFLIVLLQSFPESMIRSALQKTMTICEVEAKGFEIIAGVSQGAVGIDSLPGSYRRALSVLKIAKKQKEKLLCYEDIGIYQLLIEIENTRVLSTFYEENLRALDDFDEKNGTDYLDTLRRYLEQNGSVQAVAKDMFVHRNTINYKLKKIKEILNCELDYQDGVRLLLALKARELLS